MLDLKGFSVDKRFFGQDGILQGVFMWSPWWPVLYIMTTALLTFPKLPETILIP